MSYAAGPSADRTAPTPARPVGAGDVPVIAILRRLAPDRAFVVACALAGAGIPALELTIDSPDVLTVIGRLRAELPDTAIGAGTVLTSAEVVAAADAGAQFVVSPNVDERVVATCVEAGIPSLPGAATPTEVVRAWESGASMVKLFPAGPLGPATIRALRGPLPAIPLVAVGGVDGTNAVAYLEAGAAAVGIGSWLAADGDPRLAARRAAELVARATPISPSAHSPHQRP